MPTENLAPMDALSEKEQIQILLSEYTALRAEIVSRTGYSFQIRVVVAAVITWLLQQPPITWQVAIGLAVVALFVLWFSLLNIRDTWRVADRIKELEHEINSRAGEHLLVWERLWVRPAWDFFRGSLVGLNHCRDRHCRPSIGTASSHNQLAHNRRVRRNAYPRPVYGNPDATLTHPQHA